MNHKQIASSVRGGTRYNSLDKLKTLCAFLIVCIHAPFPGTFGEYYTALTRIAVPIFFMITGFFYKRDSAAKQIRKLLMLMLTANGIYFIWKCGLAITKGKLRLFLSTTFTVKNLAKFLLLNETHLQSHLWYLGAIFYVIMIVTAMPKNGERILYVITPLLLLGDLVLGKYSLLILHQELPYSLVRNWLFVGLPYFIIGMWIRERNVKLEKRMLEVIIGLTAIITLLERYLLVSNNLNAMRDHYISTTFLAISVFLLFLYFIGKKENIVSRIGREDSTWIYILHPIFITLLGAVMKKVGADVVYGFVRPMLVFAFTTAFVEVVMKIRNKIRG